MESSVLPFSKILEKIIYKRLNKYFTRHHIQAKEQFGFRTKQSTNHVITDITNKLQNYCDNKYFTSLILPDLSKAFDTVDYQIVVKKLPKYGIRDNFLQLLNDYFTNRKQFVCINNTYSRQQDVSCGVPQSSVLGPLLFTIYINDLPNTSKFEIRLFADDTVLILSHKNKKSLGVKVNSELIKSNGLMLIGYY